MVIRFQKEVWPTSLHFTYYVAIKPAAHVFFQELHNKLINSQTSQYCTDNVIGHQLEELLAMLFMCAEENHELILFSSMTLNFRSKNPNLRNCSHSLQPRLIFFLMANFMIKLMG